MKLIVTRHGETEWNDENKVLGRTDVELNQQGVHQAEELSEQLEKVHIDAIFSSPLRRAVVTAQIIAKSHEGINVCPKEQLIEQDYGVFEGVDRDNPEYQIAKREFFSRFPGGESYSDVVARVYPFIEQLKEKYDDKCVLIVVHGGICRLINNYFFDMDNESFASYTTKNCEVKEYEV